MCDMLYSYAQRDWLVCVTLLIESCICVTWLNESCHTYKSVTLRIWIRHVEHCGVCQVLMQTHDSMSHVTHTSQSRTRRIWIRHVEHCGVCQVLVQVKWVMSHIQICVNDSRQAYVYESREAYVNESRRWHYIAMYHRFQQHCHVHMTMYVPQVLT